MAVAVIGSGVSGVFAAHALAQRGLAVTILDVGETLEPRRRAIVSKLREMPPSSWPANDDEVLRHNETIDGPDLPKKMHFGSDYIYAEHRPFAAFSAAATWRVPYPTFAKGGFSNIWGAAILPADSCDMSDWPISRAEMDPYYRKVAALMPICGGIGTLAAAFPAYRDALGELDPGPQGTALLADLARAEPRLRQTQLLYGKARLAIHTAPAEGVLPCSACGECFTGCVRDSIFSTLPLLHVLSRDKGVVYRPGLFVESVEEDNESVRLTTVDVSSGDRSKIVFDAVFVAAGPINSTRLLLRSKGLYDLRVRMKESQKFLFPALRWAGAETGITHPAVTLASVFLETKVSGLSDHWFHTQMIPMNSMIAGGSRLPGVAGPFGKRAWSPLLRHAMVAWSGLHSDHSSAIELMLRRSAGGDTDELAIDLHVSPNARAAAKLAAKDLFAKGLHFGTLFCHWMLRFANPGSGTHCGASFPMRAEPKDTLDSDQLGRPFGWSRVFVVDSTVLPSIPGTTLAFPVMANAYRIASSAPI